MTRRESRRRGLPALVVALALLPAAGCGRGASRERPAGFVLINLSGLRADALGATERGSAPTPFLDSLAGNGLAYDRAFAVSSDPLTAVVSLFAGLYPQEHGVSAPAEVLAAEAPVLAEKLAGSGYRTAAVTGGGYASPDFGIDRGFDELTILAASPGDPDPVFRAGLDFLRRVGGERFFLYLHSDALAGARLAAGSLGFGRLTAGYEDLTPELVAEVRRAYGEAVEAADRSVGDFLEAAEALGLSERMVVVVTADRAFELGEHGRFGHAQIYPESLRVPLVLAVPGLAPGRSRALVQTVDIAASLYDLAGLPAPVASGRVLPGLAGAPAERTWAAAETRGRWAQESLILESGTGTFQLVESRLRGEYDGTWVTREIAFDTEDPVLEFKVVSYLVPRTVSVRVDGLVQASVEAGVKWAKARIELPPGGDGARRRVVLSTPGCASPSETTDSIDRRCLSFKIAGLEFARREVFDLEADPEAARDLSFERPELLAEMTARLAGHRWLDLPPPEATRPGAEVMRRILSSGEYPEPPRP